MFSQNISIYAHARDATGQYREERVDEETGEIVSVPVQTMTIHDFCLSDHFKEKVQALRKLQTVHGLKAKEMPEYIELKKSLPAATLSGLFSYRRQTDLIRHSGYIVLDMDWQDNRENEDWLDWEEMKREYFRHFPEIALCMRSCSGTGYFALVPLAYPEQHKAQARAIMDVYRQRHIILDASCKDPTRLRFASWDSSPYINLNAVPFTGIDNNEPLSPVVRYTREEFSHESRYEYIERLVSKLEAMNIDITPDYDAWVRIGWSLKEFGEHGRRLFHRVSRLNPNYRSGDTDRKWAQLGNNNTITSNYFIHQAKQALHI